MKCSDIQNELVAFLLDELNPADQAIIERHLADGCNECNLQLSEIRESVELLWQSVPNRRLTEDFQREVLDRALDISPQAETARAACATMDRTDSKASFLSNFPVQLLVAFAAGLLFAVAFQSVAGDRVRQSTIEMNRLSTSDTVSLASPQIPGDLEMIERQHEGTRLVSLRKKAGTNELRGFVLWDTLAREIHLYCFGLTQPQPGSQYSLWLVGPSIEVRAAERLDIDAHGNCKAVIHWPDGEFRFARVTVERTSSMNSRPSDNVELTSNALPVFPR